MKDVKLCVNCMNHVIRNVGADTCGRKTGKINLVTGGAELSGRYCTTERLYNTFEAWIHSTCGRKGRFFEAKQ